MHVLVEIIFCVILGDVIRVDMFVKHVVSWHYKIVFVDSVELVLDKVALFLG